MAAVARSSSRASVRSPSVVARAQPKAALAAAAQMAIKGPANKQPGLPSVAGAAAANVSNAVVANASAGNRPSRSSVAAKASVTKRISSDPAGANAAAVKPAQKGDVERPRTPSEPLSISDAENMLKILKPNDLAALANSSDAVEQAPACMMLEYVGDNNLTWSNAQASLLQGAKFVKEILGMQRDRFITKRSLERLEKLGHLDIASLRRKDHAAFVLATYLEACIAAAKERLGITPAATTIPEQEAPALWPMKISFKDIEGKAQEAAHWGKTALFICNGRAGDVDTFFAYQGGGCTSIDATAILNQVVVTKVKSVEAARAELHRRIQGSMLYGKAIHISLGRTALDFQGVYCGTDELTTSLFKNSLLKKDNPEIQKNVYSFVTTDFDLESAREHLSKALPHFDDMAIIEIDPSSFA
jgi:hypothetical protein